MTIATAAGRVRAFGYFIIAASYFFFAQLVAAHAARGLVSGDWFELTERTILLFLLLIGYTAMGRAFQRQAKPLKEMGLVFRSGWLREFGLGAGLGWGMMIASILPLVLSGGLIVTIWTVPRQFLILFIDLLLLAVAALGEEVAFRGYPFQRLIDAIGPFLATLVLSALFGLAHLLNPSSSAFSVIVTVLAGWLLSVGYLRTRALWLSWGWHFAWNASMGLLFGLPVSGLTRFSPVIQSNTIGPLWMTGGDYGPEGSVVTAVILLIGLVLLFRLTREYAYRHAQPAIIAAGIPVDLDAMRPLLAPHHNIQEAAAEAPSKVSLVQIDTGRGVATEPRPRPRSPFQNSPDPPNGNSPESLADPKAETSEDR